MEAFGTAPKIAFAICAICLCVLIRDPIFCTASFALAAIAYILAKGLEGIRMLLGSLTLVLLVAIFNCAFNSEGATQMFQVLNRSFTFESLAYGLCFGLSFATVLLLFAWMESTSAMQAAGKMIGRFAPKLSLLLSSTLRFIPLYSRQSKERLEARAGIGKSAAQGTPRQKVEEGAKVFGSLVGSALEGSAQTALSMRGRGYGSGPVTNYQLTKTRARNVVAVALIAAFAIVVAFALASGTLDARFYPTIQLPARTPLMWVCLSSYICMYAIGAILGKPWRRTR